jgi:hypothetical protein
MGAVAGTTWLPVVVFFEYAPAAIPVTTIVRASVRIAIFKGVTSWFLPRKLARKEFDNQV